MNEETIANIRIITHSLYHHLMQCGEAEEKIIQIIMKCISDSSAKEPITRLEIIEPEETI